MGRGSRSMKKSYFKKFANVLSSLSAHRFLLAIVLLVAFAMGVMLPRQPDSVGVVDLTRVYQQSKAFAQIRQEQTELEDMWRLEAANQKSKLEAEDKELSQKKRRLKKAVFDRKVADLKLRILDFQNQQMARLDLIRYRVAQIMQSLEKQTQPLLAQVAENRKLRLVVPLSATLYSQRAIDITDDVIAASDEAFANGQLTGLQIVLDEGE